MGPAFVAQGATAFQLELAINLGVVFGKKHLLSIGTDSYSVSFPTKNSEIASRSSQAGLFYTYSLR